MKFTNQLKKNTHQFFSFLFMMMFLCSIFTIPVHGQNIKNNNLTLNVQNLPLSEVFQKIGTLTNYKFFYDQSIVDKAPNITINVQNATIQNILDRITAQTNLYFQRTDNTISVSATPPASSVQPRQKQRKTISGIVTDASGEPIIGANIIEKGTTNGTVTDIDGKFSLSVEDNAMLHISYIGYLEQDIPTAGKTTFNIILQEDIRALEEVVVVGYGTQKRSDISGSIATVKVDALVAHPTSDLQGMLKGKVPGLYVTQNDARPGGSSNILLRGIRSLKGGNSPLYVVDGAPLSTINELNINDVESISILKDASSQAIYGARASNGVILITTKRGKNTNDKVEVSYHGYYSIQNVDPNFEIFSPEEYIQIRREAYRGDLATAQNGWLGTYPNDYEMFTPLELESMAAERYVNWTDYAFKKDVPLTKHDISLAGGNEKTRYSASLGYYYQDGIRFSSDLKRYSGKLTLDQEISETVKTGLSVYYTTYTQNQETNAWTDFITFSPISQIYDENGDLIRYPTGDGKSVNPLLYEEFRNYEYNAERIILNGYLEITPKFLPGLKYRLNASLDSRNRESDRFNSFDDPSYLAKGYAQANFYNTRDYLLENIITYDQTFGQDHKLDITVMQGIEPRYITSTTAAALQLGNDFFGIDGMGSALESQVGRSKTERKMVSFMGRANYIFQDKYLLNFTMRADGSSVFGANHKWGYFPSAAIAWNLHKESFVQSVPWINEAKIRVSYGQIGNQAIDPYGSLATADNAFYVSNGASLVGYLPGTVLPNPDLRWETTTTFNTGIDFSLIEHRLSGSIDYYQSNTIDLLVNRSVPNVLGYSSIPTNLGEIENRGIEASVTGFIISNNQLTWSVTANFSKNKNKLVKGVLQDPETGEYIDDIANRWFIGKPVNIYYDYQFDGIWQLGDDIANSAQPNARPGDVKVADLSGPEGIPDGIITTDDRTIIRRDPKWIGSVSTSLRYKGFELSADLYTVQGVTRFNEFYAEYNYGGMLTGVLNGIKRDYWTPENPSNTMFRPHVASYTPYFSALKYKDASYLRLRNVTISYNLPKKWIKTAGLSDVKIYVAGDNLWTKTDYLSYSPESEPDSYPETRNYTFGVNINF